MKVKFEVIFESDYEIQFKDLQRHLHEVLLAEYYPAFPQIGVSPAEVAE